MVCSLSVLDTTFHIDTENHVCIFDMKVQTNFFSRREKGKTEGKSEKRRKEGLWGEYIQNTLYLYIEMSSQNQGLCTMEMSQ